MIFGQRHFTPLMVLGLLAFVLASSPVMGLGSGDRVSSEEEIKAAYLFNFLKFADWNSTTLDETLPDEVFVMSVVGESPMNKTLQQLAGRVIRGRVLEVLFVEDLEDLLPSHLIYTGERNAEEISRILGVVTLKGALTVGESELFVQEGGIIGFFLEEGVVRFLVGRNAASEAGIRLHTQLLQVARFPEGG